MTTSRRLATVLTTLALVLAMAIPASATQWSILDCTFEGLNWMGANTAFAKTRDVNGKCDELNVILKYKVDGFWYTVGPASSDGSYVQLQKVGADDAAGSHRAYRYGASSGWKDTI